MAGLIILQVERRVEEGEVREQTLRRRLHREPEQVVVGVAGIRGNAVLDLEDLDRVDRRLAVAEAGLCGEQQIAYDHAALGTNVGTVIERGKRHLRAGAAVHRIKVVD
ncbi:hypothetical protein SDC9_187041 [bioreactor metagenome]|uniref:Uncharacterized protein n=1 Tax=bioreactor metagenome TaxID=1076179 RepID=A0A645HVY3_9ZZZZ